MLISTFRLPCEALALAPTLEAPGLEVEAERIAAHSTAWTTSCLWATAGDFRAVDEAIAADPTVASIVDAIQSTERKYYQRDWTDEVAERIDTYVDSEGSILNARATSDGWTVRFVDRGQFDAFRGHLRDRGRAFELVSLVRPDGDPRPELGLTPTQQESVLTRT